MDLGELQVKKGQLMLPSGSGNPNALLLESTRPTHGVHMYVDSGRGG